MEIYIKNVSDIPEYHDEIIGMLIEGDRDFFPPLSQRTSITQSELSGDNAAGGSIMKYFEEMKTEKIVCAVEEGKLLAFVTYLENLQNSRISETELPNIYISTLLAKPECRGRGITKQMYTLLFEEYKSANIFTRTWGTNFAHIKILDKFGFSEHLRIKDDRAPGVDTVYFVKRP